MKPIKDLLAEFEYNEWSCGGRLNGINVRIINLKTTKKIVRYDVIISDDDNTIKRFNDCYVNLSEIERRAK